MVSDDVFAGSMFRDDATEMVRMEIYATEPSVINEALDEIDSEARDRVDVIQSVYSANELQDFVERAEASLRAVEVEVVWIHTGFDTGQIEVSLMTPDGQPDPDIESRARAALEGLPAVLAFSGPMQPLLG